MIHLVRRNDDGSRSVWTREGLGHPVTSTQFISKDDWMSFVGDSFRHFNKFDMKLNDRDSQWVSREF